MKVAAYPGTLENTGSQIFYSCGKNWRVTVYDSGQYLCIQNLLNQVNSDLNVLIFINF